MDVTWQVAGKLETGLRAALTQHTLLRQRRETCNHRLLGTLSLALDIPQVPAYQKYDVVCVGVGGCRSEARKHTNSAAVIGKG